MRHQRLGLNSQNVFARLQSKHALHDPLLMFRHPAAGGFADRFRLDNLAVDQQLSRPRVPRRVAQFNLVFTRRRQFDVVLGKILLSTRITDDADVLAVAVAIDRDVAPVKILRLKQQTPAFSQTLHGHRAKRFRFPDHSAPCDQLVRPKQVLRRVLPHLCLERLTCLAGDRLVGLFELSRLVAGFFQCRHLAGGANLALVPVGHDVIVLHRVGALEDAGHRVIALRRDRVELVVMTPRAADAQPHERLADRVDLLVDDIQLHFAWIRLGQNLCTDHEKAGRNDPPPNRLRIVPNRHQVASNLLLHELVERLVAIECVDHIVPVLVGVGKILVLVAAVRVAVTRHIEPVPPPALAMARRGKQPIHRVGPSL